MLQIPLQVLNLKLLSVVDAIMARIRSSSTMMGLCLLLALFIIPFIIHNVVITTIPTTVYGQNQTNATQSNATQTTQGAANETEASVDKTKQGVEQTINGTVEFVGNVSETIAKNPVVGNAIQETQFFAEQSK
jgi:predicted PurR-regulated permease PerM